MNCFPFFWWIKFCSGCLIQVFSFGGQKKWSLVALDNWSSYIVKIVWELAWAESVLVILDEWSSYTGGCISRFDGSIISIDSNITYNIIRKFINLTVMSHTHFRVNLHSIVA